MFNIKKRKLRFSDFPTIDFIEEKRDKTTWKAKSHNKEKQIFEFIQHTYFSYEAPVWALSYVYDLMKVYLKGTEVNKKFKPDEHKKSIMGTRFNILFEAIQSGKGFYDLLKEHMTKKEIHYLIFKTTSENLNSALMEAKLLNLNADKKIIEWVLFRFTNINDSTYLFIEYLIKKNVDYSEFQELFDYFLGVRRQFQDTIIDNDKVVKMKDFLKRDINTIRQASNEWHVMQTKAKNGRFVEWNKMYENMIIEKGDNIFEFVELTSSKQLLNEGKTMKHCVGSYSRRCVSGNTKIVSLKKNGSSYITLELNPTSIIQAKLKFNEKPSADDMNMVNNFAKENGLRVAC